MESALGSYSSWLVFLVSFVLTWHLFKKFLKRQKFVKLINKIPGPRGLPFLGNVKELGIFGSSLKYLSSVTVLYQTRRGFAKVFQNEKMFRFWIFGFPIVNLNNSQSIEPVITSNVSLDKPQIYKLTHPWLGKGLVTSSGEKWRKRRRMLTPAFHFKILQDFLTVMNEQAIILVDKFQQATDKDWIDVTSPLSLCTLDIICETAMGISINAQNNVQSDYVKSYHTVSHSVTYRAHRIWLWPDFIYYRTGHGQNFKESVQHLHRFTDEVIAHRKNEWMPSARGEILNKRKAFLDLLLEKHFSDESFTEIDIKDEVNTFMFAGHDTTATAMTWALYLIGLHLDVQLKLQEELKSVFGEDKERHATPEDIKELKYMDLVIKESQRIYPPVPGISRVLGEDTLIEGRMVPKGTTCQINVDALHQNSEVFPNPELFDPDRFLPENYTGKQPYAYLPFSAGPRNCIGQRFALLEEKVLLSFVLRNFRITSVDPRDKVLLKPEIVLRPCRELRIKFENISN